MEYVVMSLEEAKKVAKKDAIVLVSKQDLEHRDCNLNFTKKKFCECKNILEEAATIAKVCDEFANQLRVFFRFTGWRITEGIFTHDIISIKIMWLITT